MKCMLISVQCFLFVCLLLVAEVRSNYFSVIVHEQACVEDRCVFFFVFDRYLYVVIVALCFFFSEYSRVRILKCGEVSQCVTFGNNLGCCSCHVEKLTFTIRYYVFEKRVHLRVYVVFRACRVSRARRWVHAFTGFDEILKKGPTGRLKGTVCTWARIPCEGLWKGQL